MQSLYHWATRYREWDLFPVFCTRHHCCRWLGEVANVWARLCIVWYFFTVIYMYIMPAFPSVLNALIHWLKFPNIRNLSFCLSVLTAAAIAVRESFLDFSTDATAKLLNVWLPTMSHEYTNRQQESRSTNEHLNDEINRRDEHHRPVRWQVFRRWWFPGKHHLLGPLRSDLGPRTCWVSRQGT